MINKRKEFEQELMIDVYNLLLTPDINDAERQYLLAFKEGVEKGEDFNRSLSLLSKELGTLAINSLHGESKLSPPVSEFYKKVMGPVSRKENLAKGLLNL